MCPCSQASIRDGRRRGDSRAAGPNLSGRLRDNGRILLHAYRAVEQEVRENRAITPADEWLLDNLYVAQERAAQGVKPNDSRALELAQTVASLEIDLRSGNDLPIGGMVRCLDPDDLGFHVTRVRVQVSKEFELR